MRLTRFGTGSRVFSFETGDIYPKSLSTNFGNTVPRTTRLPDMDGGFDSYGTRRAPVEIGKVRFDFTMTADNRAAMDAKRAAVMAMADWGRVRLFRMVDGSDTEQWCDARINSIQMNEDRAGHSDLWQSVSINWQVPDPAWYAQGTEAWAWGDGTQWGNKPWGGAGIPIAAAGLSTTHTETVAGNASTWPRILVTPGTGNSCTNPTVERLVDDVVVDSVSYTGTLSDSQTLKVDTRALAVTVGGVDAFADFDYLRGGWFELPAGANVIRIRFANVGDVAGVRLRYFERWR